MSKWFGKRVLVTGSSGVIGRVLVKELVRHSIVRDSSGFLRLDPIPGEIDLNKFYNAEYYESLNSVNRAPDLRRSMNGGEEGVSELDWLSKTVWLDINDILSSHIEVEKRMLLDFGCGPGHFARYMSDNSWDTTGIEPSDSAATIATNRFGLNVYQSLDSFLEVSDGGLFDAITLLNVLEHVRNPKEIIGQLGKLMHNDGLLVIRVPNDFTELQAYTQKALNVKPWWISAPDHINYFNFSTLARLLDEVGFIVVDKLGDFPMEMFLLFGDDYTSDPAVGKECHRKRKLFELAITPQMRRSIYRGFAESDIGRDCLVFAKLEKN